MKQGKSLTALAQALEQNAEAKRDLVSDARSIDMTLAPESQEPQLQVAGDSLNVTDHCHRQIATWSGIGTRYYEKMRDDSPALLAGNVNHWLHKESDKECRRMVRTMDGTARAFLSDRYLRLDNEHVFRTALEALQDVPEIEVKSCDVTDKSLYIKAVFPRTTADVKVGDTVQSGVLITNSEIGAGAFQVLPLTFRLVCLNGMVRAIRGKGLRKTHLGGKVESGGIEYQQDTIEAAARAALLQCRDAVTTFADPAYFAKHVEQLRNATEGERVQNPIAAVEVLGKAVGLDSDEQKTVVERFIVQQDYSRYGLLNAVTNIANDTKSYDRATELEMLGGKILDLPKSQWHEIAIAA